MTALVFPGEPDAEGWAPVVAAHHRPDDLAPERRAQGIEVDTWDPPADTEFRTHTAFVQVETGVVEYRPVARPVDPRRVRALFTHAERRAIKLADGLDVAGAADLAILWEDVFDRETVTLDDPAVADLLDWLVARDLLTAERRDAIASGQPPA
ncbi:hypothetical protein [Fodinicurvata sp. EGI_FJ10296]|uniref:hypothetical protein n=1 Tax=Fodinicurvata sp. EGI_FJ10296 TaxID=3231908 RepID=UPI0034557ABD